MAPSSFDVQTFLDYLGGDRELAAELLAAFAEDAPQRLQALARAVAANNAEDAVRAAHSLKGMCGVVRDQEAVSLALDLEMAGRRGDLASLRAGLPPLEQALDHILETARAFLAA
jgi:HPt (histidine-containing phosphotransfer) domain-containing protein